ncbi:MAG: M24 family metallopeptidase [archaeon]|nr:M24 family metallopeptidase [archaeon]MDA1168161.1 M24 family metallopeptidase [archaeon]
MGRRGVVACFVLVLMVSAVPTSSACETEVANAFQGKFPSPTGISPNKDDSIRESVRLAKIGQNVAREMLWQVLMGANLTEAQVKVQIDRALIENGSNPDWPSFGTIVAAGENGAIPHGDPINDGAGPRVIQPGDVVVVDLGARVNDWVSDVTRTYVVGGTTNATIIKAYMAVYDAQNLTFPLIEAGTPAWVLDDIARTHIEEQGFGDNFIHSLGHGFGVCVHEPPLLSSGTDDPLFGLSYNQQPLMAYDAVTIEPGIYLDGWFGIRIEDDFLVNTDGHEFMTEDLPRDLDWFMITKDDYDLSNAWTPQNTESNEVDNALPMPVGLVEIVVLLGVAVWHRGQEDEEFIETSDDAS